MGSARVKDWWISRHAVLAVLKAHYDQNFSSSSLAISISHTANAAIAILSTEVNAIGVDIEPAGREINDCVIDRIKHPKDIRMSDRLDCWVTKEAV